MILSLAPFHSIPVRMVVRRLSGDGHAHDPTTRSPCPCLSQMVGAAAGKLVVVDYSTTWCGPCKMMAPKFDELSDKYDNAVFAKVIGDSCAEAGALLKREGVRSVPAFHFWKGGKRVDTMSGADPEKLEATIVDNV
jgi:thioredoxin 1